MKNSKKTNRQLDNYNPDEIIRLSYQLANLESKKGYLHFLDHIVVDCQSKKLPFRKVAESWQWERSRRSSQAVDYLAGVIDEYSGPFSFWNGYHKGSDKTHDTAREICYLMAFARKRLNLYVCGGSEDQAGIVTKAMKGIVEDNPWLQDKIFVTELTAKSLVNHSQLHCLSMNAYTSQGVSPDYLVAEEVTHWLYDEGRKFWDFILSSVNKRPGCVLKVCTNAGHIGSWQWKERERIRKSQYWSFYEAPVGPPLASWMNFQKIQDDSSGMTQGERDRLYFNRWVDAGEELGYLTIEECERCIDQQLQEQESGRWDREYVLVIDYGGINDRSALAILHGESEQGNRLKIVVDRLDCWQGSPKNRVDILCPRDSIGQDSTRSIEGWLRWATSRFRVSSIVLDPHQLESLAILYERMGYRVQRFRWRQGQANYRMAQLLKTSVQNQTIRWSPKAGYLPGAEDDTLAKELSRLVIKQMSYGYRFDHQSGRHDDRACVLAMGLVALVPETTPSSNSSLTVVQTEVPPALSLLGPQTQLFPENLHQSSASIQTFGVVEDFAEMNGICGLGLSYSSQMN